MSNIPRTCPVCGAPQTDPNTLNCAACKCVGAFYTQFSGENAYNLWLATINRKKEEQAARLYTDSRNAGCTLQVSGNAICFHNPKTEEARVYTFGSGDTPTVLKNVRQVSLCNLYQLILHHDGTVSSFGDDYYNHRRGLSRITNGAFVAATDACAYVVKEDGTVAELGLNDFSGEPSGWTDIQKLSANSLHIVGLKKDGTVVYAMSPNSPLLQLARQMSSWINVQDVLVSEHYILALHKNGTVSCIGPNTEHCAPTTTWRNIVAIAADKQYAIGLTADGNVLLAGIESVVDYGRKNAKQWKNMAFIAAGSSTIVGLTNSGELLMTGTRKADGSEITFTNSIREILK